MDLLPPDPVQVDRRRRSALVLDRLVAGILVAVVLGGALRSPRARSPPLPPPLAVDLARADESTLRLLPGIGEARARAIVADRRHRGPVPHLEALARIPGIGPGIVGKLKRTRWVRAVVGTPTAVDGWREEPARAAR